jgi:hypothetical protein
VKPHIKKFDPWMYICESTFYGTVGHRHSAFGFGKTPEQAYAKWKEHWGVKKALGK